MLGARREPPSRSCQLFTISSRARRMLSGVMRESGSSGVRMADGRPVGPVEVIAIGVGRRRRCGRRDADAVSRARLVDAVHRVMVDEREQQHAGLGRRGDDRRWW
jgi:hypothetical protein